jgi:hypothetical protein
MLLQEATQPNPTLEIIKTVIDALVVLIPVIFAWYARTYVKTAKSEKQLAAIVQIANSAIDFAEDLDKRGDLAVFLKHWNLPDDIINHTSTGIQKLNLAGKWMESELTRMNISMTREEAKDWIASEFQKRVGNLGQERQVVERTAEIVNLIHELERSGMLSIPAEASQAIRWADHIADWVLEQLGEDKSGPLREGTVLRLQTELLKKQTLSTSPTVMLRTDKDELDDLARQAVVYIASLNLDPQFSLPKADIAVAWVLTKVTEVGLQVTTEQIAESVKKALST